MAISTPTLAKVMAPRSVERVAPPPASALNSPSPSPSPLPSAGEDVSYEEAIRRREAKELEDAKLLCSLENKEACLSEFGRDPLASLTRVPVCSG